MDDLIDPHLLAIIHAENSRRATRLGTWSIIAGTFGTAFEFLNQCSLLAIAPGSSIRPMGMELCTMFLVLYTWLVALPLAVSAIMVGRRWSPGIVGLILGNGPLVVAIIVGRFIISAQGLNVEP